jgi:uncharacterized protein
MTVSLRKICSLLILMCLSDVAVAASFDCAKARAGAEEIICGNEALSRLDEHLGTAYQFAVGNAQPSQKSGLVSEQRAWISSVRNECPDSACLFREYQIRIKNLARIKGEQFDAEYVIDKDEALKQTAKFQRDLNDAGIPGEVSDCNLIVRLNLDGSLTGGTRSPYGAVCHLNKKDVMVCNDSMIGKLTLKLYGFTENGAAVAYFTQMNCPYGG